MLTVVLILAVLNLIYQWGAVKELKELNKDLDQLITELNNFADYLNTNTVLNHMRVDHIEERLTSIQSKIISH